MTAQLRAACPARPAIVPRLSAARPAGDYDADGLITPAAYLGFAQQWRDAGASLIGGCCGVGPQHIRLLASCMAAASESAGSA
jgi:hypothetical protein